MNEGTLKASQALREGEDARERERQNSVDRDEIRRAFALAFSATAASQEPPRVRLGEAPEVTPTRWRPSDVSMTEFGDQVIEASGGLRAGAPDENTRALVSRLQTAVNTGELGRVGFIVDRSNSGLSIVVEVENDAAFRAVENDKQTLLGTLRAAGMTVLSFRILNRGGAGTGLALRGSVSDAKNPHAQKLGYSRLSSPHRDGDDGDEDEDGSGDRVRFVG
jgi:hypothetical protein